MELLCRFGFVVSEQDLKQVLTQKIGLVNNMYIKPNSHPEPWKFVCDYHDEDIESDTRLYKEQGFDVKIEKEEYKWFNNNSFIEDVEGILHTMDVKEIGITRMGHFILLHHKTLGFRKYSKGNFCHQTETNFEITQSNIDVFGVLKDVLNMEEEDPTWHIMSVCD
jgi:hypothetical protein